MKDCLKTSDGSCYANPISEFSSALKSKSSQMEESSWGKDIIAGIDAVVHGERLRASACSLDETARSAACINCSLLNGNLSTS